MNLTFGDGATDALRSILQTYAEGEYGVRVIKHDRSLFDIFLRRADYSEEHHLLTVYGVRAVGGWATADEVAIPVTEIRELHVY